jgi:hypothetical protein
MTNDLSMSSGPPARPRRILLWIFLGIGLFLSLLYVLHRNSYCVVGWRFVPESEIIDAAVAEEVRYLYSEQTVDGRKILPFKDKQEFFRLNPNCCKILRGDEEREAYNFMGFFSVITGYFGSAVEVKYKLRLEDAEGRLSEGLATITHIVSSCGEAGLGENVFGTYKSDNQSTN